MDVARRLAGPSWAHWLGQDEYGRDVLSRLIWGARVSLTVAIASALIACAVGVCIGLVGGYLGGLAELFTVRLTDVILSFPPILLALLVVTLLGPGAGTLTFVLSILYGPGFARVTYGEVLSARALEYVEAARAAGATAPRIMLRTILPNIPGPILVQFSLTVASAIVIESGLSFLGLGVVPPAPSWGLMIRGARGTIEHTWLLLLWPCAALVVTILMINRLCDALRDAFDPRTAQHPAPSVLARMIAAATGYPDARRPAAAPVPAPAPAPVPAPASGQAAPVAPPLLEVRDLRTQFFTTAGVVRAVDGVSFTIAPGETLAVVGESGSGKSITGLSILGLVPQPAGRIVGGAILFRGRDGAARDLVALDDAALQEVRGNEIAMIFQEPMTSLNPVWRIGTQIGEALVRHRGLPRGEAHAAAVRLLDMVGIPEAARRVDDFPHQLSGGMRQRVMIAMALACEPSLLIADEPTTALDVTIQAQILELLRRLKQEGGRQMSILFITHNFGVVAEMADRVAVMYAGRIVEEADVRTIFRRPRHPYTKALLGSIPQPGAAGEAGADGTRAPLPAIAGTVPPLTDLPPGCVFAPRCALAEEACRAAEPELIEVGPGQRSRCRRWSVL
ncbi:MAG: dipeptide/oligopeptide/nickel ABC transporter permease/ATP-binding protein [Alphaproteobacteria bacterium]|nr:dipeptide/oligopeptide/nickel ABC transporter permease/ATP-binding protein [Alphaproteobacteria bacterium]